MHTKNQFISAISVLSAHSMRLDRQAERKAYEYVLGSLNTIPREKANRIAMWVKQEKHNTYRPQE